MKTGFSTTFLLGLLWGSPALLAAPLPEVEPNHPCPSAQSLGSAAKPLAVAGNLNRGKGPDIDFFRVTATPGSLIRIDLEGQATSQGTLGDPYLGSYASDCSWFLGGDDDGGEGFNSRLWIQVPADGTVVIAATSSGDYNLTGQGGSGGTYRLSLEEIHLAHAVSGRVVAAGTGTPLYSSYVELRRCNDYSKSIQIFSASSCGAYLRSI